MHRFPQTPRSLAYYRANKSCFGGSLLRGNPKGRRPFHHGSALHIVLRSSRARGKLSLLRREGQVKAIVRRQAKRFGLSLYRYANSGNHLHLLLRPPRQRALLAGFLRSVAGLVARAALQAERGRANGKKFWDTRPFSRIVPWGSAFRRCAAYVARNVFEASGIQAVIEAEREWALWRAERPRGSPAHAQ